MDMEVLWSEKVAEEEGGATELLKEGLANGQTQAEVQVQGPSPPTAQELAAKGCAPMKAEFLVPPHTTTRIPAIPLEETKIPVEDAKEAAPAAPSTKISAEKKSKRQIKKERNQAKKSAENVCAAVARTGKSDSCPYGEGCRFNHDLKAFLSQKPMDLPGKCPFQTVGRECTFGVACRFAGTHHEGVVVSSVSKSYELNNLSKEFQKQLWKRSVPFPKSDAQLLALGITSKFKNKASTENSETAGVEPERLSQASENIMEENAGEEGKPSENGTINVTISKKTSEDQSIPEEEDEGVTCAKRQKTETKEDQDKEPSVSMDILNGKEYDANNGACQRKVALCLVENNELKLTIREKKLIDFKQKLYLAPLTTVGNLPFRRICKRLGADITCGEMAMCTNLLQGQASEWALLRRHSVEDVFGVQICGAYPDVVARTAEMIERECDVSFIDVNIGCPIDIVVNRGAGSSLLNRPARLEQMIKAASASIDSPLTLKVRTGYYEGRNCAHSLISNLYDWGAVAVTIHGRTRQQRYSKFADWDYIRQCASLASDPLQVIGNGDIFSYTDWNTQLNSTKLSTCMIARGALIKPWLFTEIKEQRHWDITAEERLDILKDYVRFGMEHWGSDSKGVETTRRFLLEWLSYLHRYIPVGLLEIVPQRLNWRPPKYYGRNDLETLMASDSAADWVRISEMLLGPVPEGFCFTPKHKSNAYDKAENG